jgi:hypothetical protein
MVQNIILGILGCLGCMVGIPTIATLIGKAVARGASDKNKREAIETWFCLAGFALGLIVLLIVTRGAGPLGPVEDTYRR